jgi:hypothetical protein
VEHERWGTPVASYVAGLPPDARPLDRGKPRDEDTEGGSQPADKSLINRRLSLHSQPCAAMAFLADGELAEQALNHASPLDREHKRLLCHLALHFGLFTRGLSRTAPKAAPSDRQGVPEGGLRRGARFLDRYRTVVGDARGLDGFD